MLGRQSSSRGSRPGSYRQLFERAIVQADTGERDRWLAGAAALAADVLTAGPTTTATARAPGPLPADFGYGVAARPVLARLEPLRGFAADVRGDPLVGERAAFWRAPRSVHRRLQRGDRRQPVPARRAARRGSGTPACSHRRRRGRYRRHRPARRRGRCTAPSQRLPASAAALACALSALDDGAQIGDAARLAGVVGGELETGIGALVSAGVLESGGTVQFAHPVLRAAIHGPVGRRTRAAPSLCRDEPTRAGGARRPSRSSRHAH